MTALAWIGIGVGAVAVVAGLIRGALYFMDKYLRDMGEM
jgi:hypothetical protein